MKYVVMRYSGYWCREMSEIPFYVAFDIRYNKLEPPGYTLCTQHQWTLRKHAPGDDIVLTSALIIAGWLIRGAIHFHGFHRLLSHLKRRGAASRTSYQIRKLLYVRNGPLNQPHIATRNSILAVQSDLLWPGIPLSNSGLVPGRLPEYYLSAQEQHPLWSFITS